LTLSFWELNAISNMCKKGTRENNCSAGLFGEHHPVINCLQVQSAFDLKTDLNKKKNKKKKNGPVELHIMLEMTFETYNEDCHLITQPILI